MPSLMQASRRPRRGLSLVELLVGMAVGLFVVAAASMLVATQLSDNRRLLLETQVQQDLRASLDIITRELRRTGALTESKAQQGLSGDTSGGVPNEYIVVSPAVGAAGQEVQFNYMREAGANHLVSYGFRLDGGGIQTKVGGAWQALTDANTLRITNFTVTARPVASQPATPIRLPCPKLCPGAAAGAERDCWPTLVVRELVVVIEGQAVSDASVNRRMSNSVRLRNDWLQFNDAANPLQVCPA